MMMTDNLFATLSDGAGLIDLAGTLVAAGALVAVPNDALAGAITGIAVVAMPLLSGWLALAVIRFLRSYVHARSGIAAEDNLAARCRRTRTDIFARIASIVVLMVSAGLMLPSMPEAREIGVALVASAGLAGLAVGVAAQPLLKNLVALTREHTGSLRRSRVEMERKGASAT